MMDDEMMSKLKQYVPFILVKIGVASILIFGIVTILHTWSVFMSGINDFQQELLVTLFCFGFSVVFILTVIFFELWSFDLKYTINNMEKKENEKIHDDSGSKDNSKQ